MLAAKVTDHLSELLGAGCIASIWGLSLTEIDVLTKIICTLAVSSVTIFVTLKRRKK